MALKRRLAALAVAAILAAAFAILPAGARAQAQRMGVPAYFVPGPLWSRMASGAPTVGIAIFNPASGPGTAKDAVWARQIKQCQASHVAVIGYVYTNYGKRPIGEVEAEARLYFTWYHVDGIFYDCADNTLNKLAYYKQCCDYARSLAPHVTVVINPGAQTIEAYLSVCDIVCNCENNLADYESGYSAPDWVARYPAKRFWHVIYDVPSDADMSAVVRLSKQRNAGWVFVTPLTLPNPYNDLPPNPYWTDELAALKR